MGKKLVRTDIENRFPGRTLTEATVGSVATFTLKDAGSVTIALSRAGSPLAAVNKLRRELLNGNEQIAYLLTTAQRDALLNPQEGTIIFNTTTKLLNVFENSIWVAVQMSALIVDLGPGLTITQIGYSLYDEDGIIIGSRVTTGIQVIKANKIYSAKVDLAFAMRTVIWDDPVGNPNLDATEDLTDYINQIALYNDETTDAGTGLITRLRDGGGTYATAAIHTDAGGTKPYNGTTINHRAKYV